MAPSTQQNAENAALAEDVVKEASFLQQLDELLANAVVVLRSAA